MAINPERIPGNPEKCQRIFKNFIENRPEWKINPERIPKNPKEVKES